MLKKRLGISDIDLFNIAMTCWATLPYTTDNHETKEQPSKRLDKLPSPSTSLICKPDPAS